jgi:hypothetical protein
MLEESTAAHGFTGGAKVASSEGPALGVARLSGSVQGSVTMKFSAVQEGHVKRIPIKDRGPKIRSQTLAVALNRLQGVSCVRRSGDVRLANHVNGSVRR